MARAEADWLVGLNATRALTVKHNAQLACGRVQTPTLAIIAQREARIRSFEPKTYYHLIFRADGTKPTRRSCMTSQACSSMQTSCSAFPQNRRWIICSAFTNGTKQ